MNDKKIEEILKKEHLRQERELNLIASENYTSINCMQASASVLTNKYAEGYSGKRYYGGCQMVDQAELLAIERCKQLFNAEHVNVQAHAGSQANMAVYHALLNPGDTILAMSLAHGGHLTHGHNVNFSGKLYTIVHYGVHAQTEYIDYDQMAELALKHKPKLIILGASAYSRTIDFKRAKEIADSVGAFLMADIAHIAGLVAAKLHPNPFPYADVVTSTTHKTLRGPRGGLIMCKKELADAIDRAIMPGTQGGPFMHMIAAKAVAFYEALQPEFISYQKHVIENAQTLSEELKMHGFRMVADGTDNHLIIVDLRSKNINGRDAEKALNTAGITASRSCIPNDPEKPWITSGIRLGTPAITTRGMKKDEVKRIAWLINQAIENAHNPAKLAELNREVAYLCTQFPIYTKTFVPQDLTYSQAQL